MHPFVAALHKARSYFQAAVLSAAAGPQPREPSHRLDALRRVLSVEGWLNPPKIPETAHPLQDAHWGALARVLLTDKPLPEDRAHVQAYQAAMDEDARLCAARVIGRILPTLKGPPERVFSLDIGAGLGAWSRALVSMHSQAVACMIDAPHVVALARSLWPLELADRARWVEGQFPETHVEQVSSAFDLILMCDLLHWYSPQEAQALLRAAADLAAPGGGLIVKEFASGGSHESRLNAAYFGLNMALYSERGRVLDLDALASLIEGAGWDLKDTQEDPETPGVWIFFAQKGVR